MNTPHKPITLVLLISIMLIIVNCGGSSPGSNGHPGNKGKRFTTVDINLLGEGTEIREAGEQLMDYPLGVLELKTEGQTNDSVLVMAVHGYDSRGYEWITGLKNLTEYYGSMFFYRYDWEQCPDIIAQDLGGRINEIYAAGNYKRVLIFGHSYGGMVVTFAAAELGKMKAEIHAIAAPLSGFPKLLDNCNNLSYGRDDKLQYPEWKPSVRLIQHRTAHAQDGAFRELAVDPQEIELPFYSIVELPPTMDGHRLGHNWSVTWVLDKHIGKPHRF